MSFQKTRLNVSSLFHLEIRLTSSALDPEQRQSFQRRKVRNVEQWSLSVSTILELADFIIKIFQKMQIQIKVCFRSYHFDIVLLGGNFSATLSVLINF